MTPLRFHVPPPGPRDTSQIDSTVPVLISSRLSFPAAKKPRKALSGDQNGSRPPSVPGRALASVLSIGRNHSCPFAPAAEKTMERPSGDIPIVPPMPRRELDGFRQRQVESRACGRGGR